MAPPQAVANALPLYPRVGPVSAAPPARVWRVEPWEAGGDPGVRVLVKSLDGGLLEIVRAGAGGVELAEQGQGLAAHGLPGERELAHRNR